MKERTFTEEEVKEMLANLRRAIETTYRAFANITEFAAFRRGFRHGLLTGAILPFVLILVLFYTLWERLHRE